jgi:hypothetical protein
LTLSSPVPEQDGVIHLRGQILEQRPTQRHVEYLHSPTDTQDGDPPPQGVLQQGHLEGVALGDRYAELGDGLFAVVRGI